MNLSLCRAVFKYSQYCFKKGRNNFVKSSIEKTKTEIDNYFDLFTGKTKLQYQCEISKLTRQIDIIERNLSSSSMYTNQRVNLIR